MIHQVVIVCSLLGTAWAMGCAVDLRSGPAQWTCAVDLRSGPAQWTSIQCFEKSNSSVDGDVALYGGSDSNSGLVLVAFDGEMGAVCNAGWDAYAADALCRQAVGTPARSPARFPPTEGSPDEVFLAGVACRGDEERLTDCAHGALGQSGGCGAQDGAGVICWNPSGFQDYAKSHGIARLTGGPSSTAGRAEVFSNGTWVSVCDEKWGLPDADVLCRQLGCRAAREATSGSRDGPGRLAAGLTEVECDGTEKSLTDCRRVVLSPEEANATCTRETEAGAICDCGLTVTVGDGQANGGRLRVQLTTDEFEAVARFADGFDLRSADVACREAGHPGALSLSPAAGSSVNLTGPVLASSCSGWEISLRACPVFNTTKTDVGNGVDIQCQAKEFVTPTKWATVSTPPVGLGTGAIVGIVIGCLLGLVVVIILGFLLCRNRREGPAAI